MSLETDRIIVPGQGGESYVQQQMADTMAQRANLEAASEHVYEGEEAWRNNANCRGTDPSIMFPSGGPGVDVAKRVCASCVVKEECLEYALDRREEHGVWGGASERERRRILRRRRQDI